MANNIPTTIKSWLKTLAGNQPDGSDLFSGLVDDLRAIQAAVRTWFEDAEWRDYGHAPTRVADDQFTVPGDQTAVYVAGRGIRCTDGASTFYGIITASVYSSVTTVTAELDSGALTASLSAVALGFNNANGAVRTALTPDLGDSSDKIATTGFVANTAFTGQLPAQTGNGGKHLKTDGSIASWAKVNLASTDTVDGTLPVGNGGTGVATLTGIVKGNGTSAYSAAAAGTDYQAAISASGLLKGSGGGTVGAAVSGTDIKTVDGTSLLGSGNVVTKDKTAQTGLLKGDGTNISAALSGEDIKTVGGYSLLGSGDVALPGKNVFIASGAIASAGLALTLLSDGKAAAIGGALSQKVAFVSAAVAAGSVSSAYDATTGKVVVCYVIVTIVCSPRAWG
jgi:hypothetical protein